ncbi:MAG: hypothetical protein SFU25_03635 [Candidatus Caenarcaniphilales bacterium]|nr:hypothetical protein [Candidatus Caenarcaniphilales bacterium]
MYSYIVSVSDPKTHIKCLSIPCAELTTAKLVQKNLESLFPSSKVSFHRTMSEEEEILMKNKDVLVLANSRSTLSSDTDFSILEKELFEDAA